MNKLFRLTLGFLLFTSLAYADFTPPSAEHTDDANTFLLLHCNGTDASTTFTDDSSGGAGSPHTFTARNSAQLDTAQQKFGTASGLFTSATSDYIDTPDSADWAPGTSDFTWETWIRHNGSVVTAKIIGQYANTDNAWYFQAGATGFSFFHKDGGVVRINSSASYAAISADTWYHLVWARDVAGNAWHWYIDGVEKTVSDGEGTANTTLNDLGVGTLTIGAARNAEGTYNYLNGWMDEVRYSNTLRTFAPSDTGSVMIMFVDSLNPNLIGSPAWTCKIKIMKWWKNLTWDILYG